MYHFVHRPRLFTRLFMPLYHRFLAHYIAGAGTIGDAVLLPIAGDAVLFLTAGEAVLSRTAGEAFLDGTGPEKATALNISRLSSLTALMRLISFSTSANKA